MNSPEIGGPERNDINRRVERILRDLGNPDPPLSLQDARYLLRLDLKYYSGTDASAAREVTHKLVIAGKQIIQRPTLLIDVIRKARLSALWLPDRKRILIDQDAPKLQHRWMEAHEIGHSIIEWHQHCLFGDDEVTLSQACHEQIEAEANYAAGQLLFFRRLFYDEVSDSALSWPQLKKLKARYGNSLTSTLWRAVENPNISAPMFGLISDHPRQPRYEPGREVCRHFIRSSGFAERFGNVTQSEVFAALTSLLGYRTKRPIGEGEVALIDVNHEEQIFFVSSFSNGYDLLSFGVYVRPLKGLVALAG